MLFAFIRDAFVRKHRARWVGVRLWCVLLFAGVASAASAARPNFIFILIDDMGYSDLSCFGGNPGQTVHLDALAREGMRFTQFYVGSPICSPSRIAFTTGQYPARWRVTSYLASRSENEHRGMAHWLDPKAPTLARVLQQAGYATGHFGKWHLGGQRDVGDAPLIQQYGFDESLTQFEGLGDRILPLLDAFDGDPVRKYSLGSDNLNRGQVEWMDRSKVTGAFVQRTLDFIRRAEKVGQPFYVNLWPDDVHSPFFPPKNSRQAASSKRELYLAVLKAMDEQLAPLLDYVRKSPTLRTNTVIIVTSDNGPEPGAGSTGSFRGHKGTLFEGGIRSPFIVWAPGLAPQKARGTINQTSVISALDLFPSIARLAGVSLPAREKLDGSDQSRVWLGRSMQSRSRTLFWTRPPDRPGPVATPWPDLAMRKGNWKLVMMRDGRDAELYDLATDAGETQDLAATEPGVVRRMREPLLSWWRSLPGSNQAPAHAEQSSVR